MTFEESELLRSISGWNPQSLVTEDVLSAERVGQLAATLDLDVNTDVGAFLPSLWHWIFFQDWAATADLGADGHPAHGRFFPPIPDRRRMFAGGRSSVTAPLRIGMPVRRTASIESITPKHGKTGLLFFVVQRNEFTQDGVTKLIETQDIVYRSDNGVRSPFSPKVEPSDGSQSPRESVSFWTANYPVTELTLFRFSALTANSHRIHYDHQYVTGVEGYPGVVVHGPLLAILMSHLASSRSRFRIAEFTFRLRRPVILGDAFRVEGTPAGDGCSARLAVVSGIDTVHATAEAVFA